jgi:anti-sigma regulatory factor (Ser/Thr protein kinase)
VLSQLDGLTPVSTASDAALIVSELVTNSVLHANVGINEVMILELTRLDDRIRIAVTDPGSHLEPRMLPIEPMTPGGLGLRVVDAISSDWGVARDASGPTRVWCDLPLHPIRRS